MAHPNEIAVLKAVLTQAQKVIQFDSFYAALYDRVTVQLEFPVVAQRRNGKMETLPSSTAPWLPRPYSPGEYFPDALFPEGQPLFVGSDLQAWVKTRRLVYAPEPVLWPRSWLGASLKARGRTIGFVVIEHQSREHAYDQNIQQLFNAMANRAAGTLATARLLDSLRTVNRVGQTLTAGTHLTVDEILTRIQEAIGRLMDNRDMYVALYDRGTQMLTFSLVFENGVRVEGEKKEEDYPSRKAELVDPTRGGRLAEVVLCTRESFCPLDVVQWYAEHGGPPVTAPIPKSWVGVPLMRGGQVLGVIALQNDEVAELYGSDDIEVLQAMSGAAAVALANTRLFEQLSVVNDAGQELTAGIRLNEDQILDAIYEQASRLMNTRDMYIALYDAETQELSFPLAIFDGERQYDWPSRKIDLTGEMQGLTEVVLQTQKSLCPVDVEAWYKKQNIEPRIKPVPKSWIGVPLVRENQVLGIISLQNDEVANLYEDDDITVLETLAGQAAVALENVRIYSYVEEQVRIRTQELEQRNRELQQAQQEALAAERLAATNSVAGELVHKMNNLAGTIPGRVRLAKEKLAPENPRDQWISKVLDGILVDSVRLLEEAKRIRESTSAESSVQLDVNEALSTALKRLRHSFAAEFKSGKIAVIEDYSSSPVNISAPRNAFISALENIIRNAMEAMPEGGTLALGSRIASQPSQSFVEVAISDTGKGIDTDALTKIFDPFYTTKPDGMGFGLWHAKNLVKSIRGDIDVRSTLGVGTTFVLRLAIFSKEADNVV